MLSEDIRNKTEYLVIFINEFGKFYKLNDIQAYRYLKRYGGIELIDRFYDIAHTQRFEDMVTDVAAFCHKKGGAL